MRRFTFSALVFDAESGELTRNGAKLRLSQQTARVLELLLENAGAVVTREEFRQTLWPSGEFLGHDHSINNSISQLRDLLRDDPRTPRFIETIPKRGYRFLAEVQVLEPAKAPLNAPLAGLEVLSQPAPQIAPEVRNSRPSLLRPKWAAFAAGFLVLLAVVVVARARFVGAHGSAVRAAATTYIGIAPFETAGRDADQLAESFRLDLTDAISQLPAMQVRAAHSFRNAQWEDAAAIPALGRSLHVDTLLFGKFTVKGNDCLIRFELVRARDAIHLASLQYSGTKAELASIRDRVQRDIFNRLNFADENRTDLNARRHGNTENPRAYEAYLRGRYHLSQWADDSVSRALQEFSSAAAEDPDFARAYAGMATAHFVLAEHGARPRPESYRKSKELAERALQLDPSLAEAHAMLGQILLYGNWSFSSAGNELREAVNLEPNQAIYHLWLSNLLCLQGQFTESLHEIDLAHAADTFWPPVYMTEIFLAGAARQFPRSIEAGKKLIALMPEWPLGYDQLGDTLWYSGRYSEAIEAWRKMAILEHDAVRLKLEDQGREVFRRGGVAAYARLRLQAANSGTHWAHAENDFDPSEWYVYAGFSQRALDDLEHKISRHDPLALQMAVNPPFETLHRDPRFLALLTRAGLNLPRSYPNVQAQP